MILRRPLRISNASARLWFGVLVAATVALGTGCSRDGRDMQPPSASGVSSPQTDGAR